MSNTVPSTTNSISVDELFKMVSRKLNDIKYYWYYYSEVFSYDRAQIDVLNKADGRFFRLVNDMLEHEIILGLCRLLDTPNTFGKNSNDNASVYKLVNLIPNNSSVLITSAKDRLANNGIRDYLFTYRNKLLAHNDVATLSTRQGGIIQGVTNQGVDDLLSDIQNVLDAVSTELRISPGVYPKYPPIKIVDICKKAVSP